MSTNENNVKSEIYKGMHSSKKMKAIKKQLKQTYGKTKINWGMTTYINRDAKEKYSLSSFEDVQSRVLINTHKEGLVFHTIDQSFDKYYYYYFSTASYYSKIEAYYYNEIESLSIENEGIEKRQGRTLPHLFGYAFAAFLLCTLIFTKLNPTLAFSTFSIGALIGVLVSFKEVRVNYSSITFNFKDGSKKSLVARQENIAYYAYEIAHRLKGKVDFDINSIYETNNN